MIDRDIVLRLGSGLDIAGVVTDAPLGSAHTVTLTGIGGQEPYTFTGTGLGITSGALATGHTDTDNGDGTWTLSGIATDPGDVVFSLTMEDGNRDRVTRTYRYRVEVEPLELTGTIDDGAEGDPVTVSLAISGGVKGAGYVLVSASGVPGFIYTMDNVNDQVDITGTYGSSPSDAGSYEVSIAIEDSEGAQAVFSITVDVAVEPVVVTGDFDDVQPGAAYTGTLSVSGGTGVYSSVAVVAGSAPTGAAFGIAGSDVTISGTAVLGSYSFTLRVTDNAGNPGDIALTLEIAYDAVVVSGDFDDVTEGDPYTGTLAITGGTGAYSSVAVVTGSAPSGAMLGISGSTVTITGTAVTGSYSFSVEVTDSASNVSNTYAVTVEVAALVVYTTWNSSDKSAGTQLSPGNLTWSGDDGSWGSVRSVASKSSGKLKAEAQVLGAPSGFSVMFGVATGSMSLASYCGAGAGGWSAEGLSSGTQVRVFKEGAITDYAGAISSGDYVAVYVDIDAGKGWFWATGKGFLGGGDPAAGTSPTFTFTPGTTLFLCGSAIYSAHDGVLNAGATAFQSPAKTGFGGWTA